MKPPLTQDHDPLVSIPALAASRRSWLKGLGALLGSSLLATAPTAVFASPAPAKADSPAALALAGGDEYIGIVKLLAGPAVPTGWMLCDGRLLSIAQHPALFALLKFTYGGDGHSTFALPQLTGPKPTHTDALLCAIKAANCPATSTAVAELRLLHSPRLQARRAA
ncbi:MAG: phage tail protein [Bacteroidota bacterium]|nr:phage tail protein [Bacteroidota bacterium]